MVFDVQGGLVAGSGYREVNGGCCIDGGGVTMDKAFP